MRSRLVISLVLVIAMGVLPSCTVTVPLQRATNVLLVEARINGEKAGYFGLDTGCESTTIDVSLANRFKLPKLHRVISIDPRGHEEGYASSVKMMSFGNLSMPNWPVSVMDMSEIRTAMGVEVNGILGGSLFAKCPFTIDPSVPEIVFYDPGHFSPPAGAQAIKIVIRNSLPDVPIKIDGRIEDMVRLDTGFSGALGLDQAFVTKHPGIQMGSPVGVGLAGSGYGMGSKAVIRSLDIFGHTFNEVPASVDAKKGEASQETGMSRVGNVILRNFRLTFDYANSTVFVEWKPFPTVQQRLAKGTNPNQVDAGGFPMLCLAASEDDLVGVAALVAAGADVNARTRSGDDALSYAITNASVPMAKLLLDAGTSVKAQDSTTGTTALARAAYLGHVELIEMLLEHGADVEVRAKEGGTPLTFAAMMGHMKACSLLLSRGAHVNAPCEDGRTPLSFAAADGYTDVVRLLIAHGADVAVKDKKGRIALDYAEKAGHKDIADLLRQNPKKE